MTSPTVDRDSHADELVDRARALAPALAGRAADADAIRRVPDGNLDDLVEAGLFRLFRPAELGGMDVPYGTHTRVAFELARGCPSTSWVLSVSCGHNLCVAMMDPQAAHDVWDDNPDAAVASAFGPPVERSGDHFVVDGTYSFSSGIHNSDWVLLQTVVGGDAFPPDMRYLLVPKSDIEVLDTWHTIGLRGSGSDDIRVRTEVPEYRSLPLFGLQGQPSAGAAEFASPTYRMTTPFFPIYPFTLIGPVLGAAQGALDAFCEYTKTRRHIAFGTPFAEMPTIQLAASQSSVEIDAAYNLLRHDLDRINALTLEGVAAGPLDVPRYGRDVAYAARMSVSAVDRLQADAGAHSLYEDRPFQRYWRDIHAMTSHVALNWNFGATNYGIALFS